MNSPDRPLTGCQSHPDALKRLKSCAVCIHVYRPLPWLYYNQALKVAEYMALGKAVVSWGYPGVRRFLDGGRADRWVDPGNLDQMSKSIVELLTYEELRRDFETRAHDTVADRFVWPKIGQESPEIIRETVLQSQESALTDRQ
jgi:glycosyltransferase involved in cell wall biosynthesis